MLHLVFILVLLYLRFTSPSTTKLNPVSDLLLLTLKMVVDVSQPLIEGVCPGKTMVHNLLAKATPEPHLVVSSDATSFCSIVNLTGTDSALAQMLTISRFAIIEYTLTLAPRLCIDMSSVASEAFLLLRMHLLVPFPIVLASEVLVAVVKYAAVRSRMSFEMFVEFTLS